jgi:hypothetical protein
VAEVTEIFGSPSTAWCLSRWRVSVALDNHYLPDGICRPQSRDAICVQQAVTELAQCKACHKWMLMLGIEIPSWARARGFRQGGLVRSKFSKSLTGQ